MEQQIVRQGDVLLIPVDKITGKKQPDKKVVLALGEVTGHHHRFEEGFGVKLFRDDGAGGGQSIIVEKHAELVHEEHGTIAVVPGKYRQAFQVEYTPAAIQRVAD
jgi:hypothetical protein